ncbi:CHAD domain-containing protein [Pelagibacterium halotolerans]|uniref:Adenylate cyclase n=1 Tax=Pelagibacterium halotolerans (strain DSM 22347 / JCM 15775 / CGMCC 1.7692 / B2) TaxID=1082931 RepID=G4RFJ4_PELHB|nr:CHAD domain-containing protein [Pelagibacterium halotolerans]AEQ52996.1 adenylate cyclase [Pelagibacterium halotolerans B2]QJR17346.1 inorganic triphosphatase [Pelagibacterium halotolerans]SEA97722.1 Inorganic triphosphatase YgiF, contains CYTH and CHAD domains [Pelagibacterium halotolerans]
MANEIELKLQIAPQAAGPVLQWGEAQGEMERRNLRSVYFDTPGRSLAMAGLSLRTRFDGTRHVQTVKAAQGKSAGLFARREWEKPVSSEWPELGADTPLAGLPPQTLDALAPLFSLEVERHGLDIVRGDSVIEVAVDNGIVLADDRRSAFCEIELELKSGAPHALFALARELDALAGVRLGVTTKSERGYRLLDAVAESAKAEFIPLSADQRVEDGFAAIAGACLRQYRLNEDIVLRRHPPEALHQARVGLRRLRSALTLFKPVVEDERYSHFRDELKWLAKQLGDVRDLDVLYDRARSGELRIAIARLREDAHGGLEAVLGSARARALMVDLAGWVAVGAWRDAPDAARGGGIGEFAAEALEKSFRKFKKRSDGLTRLGDEDRHEVRKLAKKLRYGSEFFAGLYTGKKAAKRHARFIDGLQAVQDKLGTLNDLAAAPGLLARNGLDDMAGAEGVLSGADATDTLAKAEAARDALVGLKPFWR